MIIMVRKESGGGTEVSVEINVVLLNWCMIDMKKYCIHILLYNYVHVYDKMNGYA